MEIPSPSSVLSPANLYEEPKGLKNQIPQVGRNLHAFGIGKVAPMDAMTAHGGSGCMAPHVNLGNGDVWSASRPTRCTSPLSR